MNATVAVPPRPVERPNRLADAVWQIMQLGLGLYTLSQVLLIAGAVILTIYNVIVQVLP